MDIKWIFFDIGSTLVDETEAYNHRAKDMLCQSDVTFSMFDKKRIEFAKQGYDGNSQAIKFFGLSKTPWHCEDEVPFCDAIPTLQVLKDRNYNLGIIANQVDGAKQRLQNWDILKFFDVVVTSAEIGVAKPNKIIFEKAVELAQASWAQCVMVGDRLDNDIIPAKCLNMKTVWIRQGLARYQSATLADGKADWIVDNLSQLTEIFV